MKSGFKKELDEDLFSSIQYVQKRSPETRIAIEGGVPQWSQNLPRGMVKSGGLIK